MKLHKEIKIEKACSKDKYRQAIREPYLEVSSGSGMLVATNGRVIAVVPVECHDGDTTGCVPLECLADARKNGFVLLNESATVNGTSFRREEKGTFPNWKAVIPNYKDRKTIKLGIDSTLLRSLADAIGTEGVVLEIPVGLNGDGSEDSEVTDSVIVRPIKTGGCTPYQMDAMGVIMPIRIT